jgi:hypothetical protein
MASLRIALALGLLAGCAHHDDGGGGMDAGTTTIALTIAPATAKVALVAAGAGYAATQSFAVMSTGSDGKVTDVTAQVDFLTDDTTLSYDHGVVTATAAGPYPFSVQYGGKVASAQLTATLASVGLGAGFAPGDQVKLDAAPDAAQTPTIAYPIAGALFPINIAPIEIHIQKSDPSQSIARIELSYGDTLDYKYYATCAASPNPGKFANACIVSIGGALATQLAGVSEAGDIQLAVRLAAADGTKLGASAPTTVAWSKVALSGGLYYWTTQGAGDTTFNTAIARYDFNGDASTPTLFLSSDSAPKVPAGQTQCVGCHAVSPDGAKLSFSLGGSTPGFFSLFDVGTTMPLQTRFTDKFAGMATFSPDGSRIVTMSYGQLTLRPADASLGVIKDSLFADTVTEKVSHPFWSPSGGHLAFVSWTPSTADMMAGQVTGDMVQGGQIWITASDGSAMTGAPKLLVPRAAGVTSYYPAISDDDRFVVFNQSSCSGPANSAGWGAGPCDGYNDVSATLHVVPIGGGAPVALTRANGGDAPLSTNSWPRWSPDHGTFRGKRLYWVAFSSRRSYGLALAGAANDTTKPQLWFAAVAVDPDGAAPASDPSFAPVWLPGQDPNLTGPRGNHTPAWTSKVVIF